ncbi:MFS transporter, DHA1 family, bicyclomycin/chloramphenicol resistance protein [Faunimonas pinastri]|uniref:Bcr/CflA family efflux transporter n=1 Tax=Faunimonas pinastri TaxID=1855383 RepID=A0A1H9FAT5_9HYPH|nr:Bcr/CflA family multidrug efflux MFS transporter [Faunimonas pinastri]SEQ34965.1 MFS transporter, DHA1 family, bicyclomycin/chloramphenicol resistance protein [Faunimonas pinastri]
MRSDLARNALILGLLSAVGPFTIDMYLPSFPDIAKEFGVPVGEVQMSLVSYFVAIAIGQAFYGPLADMYGRKIPLFAGMLIFVLSSIGCSLASDIPMLVAMRFLQGIGSCASMVIPRAMVRDLHTGDEAVRLMSLMMLVFSVSPMLAPLAGGALASFVTWRAIFWVLAGIGLIGMVVAFLYLPETGAKRVRSPGGLGRSMRSFRELIVDGRFVGTVFIAGFAQAGMFAYLAGSSFLFIDVFGLSKTMYSVVFATNAIFFIGGAQFNHILIRRLGIARLIRRTTPIFALAGIALLVLTASGMAGFLATWLCLIVWFGCLGFIIPTATVLALEPHGHQAGTASALMGTLQFAGGSVSSALVSALFNGTAIPMVGVIALTSLGPLILAYTLLRVPRGVVAA